MLSPNGLVFWIPLAPLDSQTGTIHVVPGSHKTGYRPVVPITNGYWPDVIKDGPADNQYVPVDVGPDEMLIFGPFLIHKSGDNLSKDRVRFTLQLRFNDVDTLPEKTSAFVAKRSPYLEREYRKHLNG